MPKKNNSRHMMAKSIPGDANSSDEIRPDEIRPDEIRPDESRPDANSSDESRPDEIRHIHLVGKIEGHGGVEDGEPFKPTPGFHIHRSGIALRGTLIIGTGPEMQHYNKLISDAFDNGIDLDVVINEWIDAMNIRQIQYNLETPRDPTRRRDYYIDKFGEKIGGQMHDNIMLGYQMAAYQIPGILTEKYYGEKGDLADKHFTGRNADDPPDLFVPENTVAGPALCIYGVFIENKYYKIAKCKTLHNGVKMSELHKHVRSMRGIKETDIIHFHFLDTACNFHDLTRGFYPLVSKKNQKIIKKKYKEYFKKANEMDVEGVEEKQKKQKYYTRKSKRGNYKIDIVSKSKRLKVSSFTKRRLARTKARVEAMAEDLSSSSNSEEAIAEDEPNYILVTPTTPE